MPRCNMGRQQDQQAGVKKAAATRPDSGPPRWRLARITGAAEGGRAFLVAKQQGQRQAGHRRESQTARAGSGGITSKAPKPQAAPV